MRGEVINRFRSLFNMCLNGGQFPKDWREPYIMSIYKGKRWIAVNTQTIEVSVCLPFQGKGYSRIINRVMVCTKNQLVMCMDQVFILRIISEISGKVREAIHCFYGQSLTIR